MTKELTRPFTLEQNPDVRVTRPAINIEDNRLAAQFHVKLNSIQKEELSFHVNPKWGWFDFDDRSPLYVTDNLKHLNKLTTGWGEAKDKSDYLPYFMEVKVGGTGPDRQKVLMGFLYNFDKYHLIV